MADLKIHIVTAHDVEENWKTKSTIIPLRGEQIIYDPDDKHPYARYKVGDGSTALKNLPFIIDEAVKNFFSLTDNVIMLDGGEITSYPHQSTTK